MLRRTYFFALLLASPYAMAQNDLISALTAQYPITTTSTDRATIQTEGVVLSIQKPGLQLCDTASRLPSLYVYHDGAITGSHGNFGRGLANMLTTKNDGSTHVGGCTEHAAQVGDVFHVLAITEQRDGITLRLLSEPVDDMRYYADLKFPFPKDAPPPAISLEQSIGEVLTPAAPTQPTAAPPPPAASAPVAPMAPIPPPPAPPDEPAAAASEPPSISLGQTTKQVTAAFGQPDKIVRLGAKQIYYYKDMKVTFTSGKVSNVN